MGILKRRAFAVSCAFALLTSGCLDHKEYSQADIDALIEKEVDKRMAEFIRVKEERCMEDILKEANRLADSVMIASAFFDRDTFSRPFKPEKPEKPALKTLADTTPVNPLFDKKKSAKIIKDSTGNN